MTKAVLSFDSLVDQISDIAKHDITIETDSRKEFGILSHHILTCLQQCQTSFMKLSMDWEDIPSYSSSSVGVEQFLCYECENNDGWFDVVTKDIENKVAEEGGDGDDAVLKKGRLVHISNIMFKVSQLLFPLLHSSR